MQTDLMFSRSVRCEGEAAVGPVLTREDDLEEAKHLIMWGDFRAASSSSCSPSVAHLCIWIFDLYVHPKAGSGWEKGIGLSVP